MSKDEKYGLQKGPDGRPFIRLEPGFYQKMVALQSKPFPEEHHHVKLLRVIQSRLSQLKELQKDLNSEWKQVDTFYRYYHMSFKVYRVQAYTENLVSLFTDIRNDVDWEPEQTKWSPKTRLNGLFMEIVEKGTGKVHTLEHNKAWHDNAGPLMEAYYHAKTFLDLMISCGERMDSCQGLLDSDWAAVLSLFNMR